MRTNRSIPLAVALIATLLAAACARHREEMSPEALLQKRDVELQERTDRMSDAIGKLVQHLDDQLKADPKSRPTLDVLVLSGGGDWGSFGTGYLIGWKSLSGADAMPNFDVVLGVSTGALIAPFAYLGTEADLRTIDNLYRNPKSDWVWSAASCSSCRATRVSRKCPAWSVRCMMRAPRTPSRASRRRPKVAAWWR